MSAVVPNRDVDEVELTEYCRSHLEPLKVPKRIIAVDKMPRGDAGKVKFDELRNHFDAPAADPDSVTVLEIASVTFRIPVDELSLSTSAADVSGWDSFAHISLILSAERRFGVRIPTAKVAAIRTLADLQAAIESA